MENDQPMLRQYYQRVADGPQAAEPRSVALRFSNRFAVNLGSHLSRFTLLLLSSCQKGGS